MHENDQRLILLSPQDNIMVLGASVSENEMILIEGEKICAEKTLTLGHKLARRFIKAGEVILKYGAPIGTAIADIPKGAHVHTHNITSNYTKTHTLEAAQQQFGART